MAIIKGVALIVSALALQACFEEHTYGPPPYYGSSYGYAPGYAYASPPVVYRDYDARPVVRDRDDRWVDRSHERVESNKQERAEHRDRDRDHDNDRR
ncbi:MAG TPA: hypothetical protein VEU51_17510 [Candidatus Acidoferrales bacterium]|nr:hypothetical protein [Candidatus Acidoferrales bacterium]